jgi:hypothetical protein
MSTPLILESLTAEFDHWRKQKKNAQSRIPTSLKKKASALLNQYPRADILKALQIPEHRFTSWCCAPFYHRLFYRLFIVGSVDNFFGKKQPQKRGFRS